MNRLHSALGQIAQLLTDLERKWALVGGLAVSARAEPRFTRDIDLAVLVDGDDDAENLVHALTLRGSTLLATVE